MIDEVVRLLIRALEGAAIPYMVVGSYFSNYYGVPRSTKDLDVLVQVSGPAISELKLLLGPKFIVDPQTSFETATFSTKNVVRLKASPFEIELFHLMDDDYDQERFRRRVQIHLSDCSPFLPTPEDVIITKLKWLLSINRDKDRLDVFNVIQARYLTLDWPYIEFWCDKHGTRQLLEELRRAANAS